MSNPTGFQWTPARLTQKWLREFDLRMAKIADGLRMAKKKKTKKTKPKPPTKQAY